MRPRQPPHRSPAFLAWAKAEAGPCCIPGCRARGVELHHWAEHGLGQRCSDFAVARVCRRHHERLGGHHRRSLGEVGREAWWEALVADAHHLLAGYAAYLERLLAASGDPF